MHSAFLIIRSVFFALLTYIHLLILVFASWNIIAIKSSGMSTPGASVFLIVCSVLIFVLVPIAYLSELICTRPAYAYVRVECVWTVLMSSFQLAASVYVTANGPPMYCYKQSPWAICASSSLLVCVTWLATFTIFSYCLTICVTSSTHATYFPDIWITPVSRVPWFRPDTESSPLVEKPARKDKMSSTPWNDTSYGLSKYIAERWGESRPSVLSGFTKTPQSTEAKRASRPSWACQDKIRRGIDTPFARAPPQRKEPPVVLAPPPRTRPRDVVASWDSHFVKVIQQPPRTATVSQFSRNLVTPLPEWARADAASGITVYQESIFSHDHV